MTWRDEKLFAAKRPRVSFLLKILFCVAVAYLIIRLYESVQVKFGIHPFDTNYTVNDFIHENFQRLEKIEDSFTAIASTTARNLEKCPQTPPNLIGRVKLLLENVTEKATEELLTKGGVGRGGFSHPTNCSACEKLAVVVPYRARPQQLVVLLANLHPMLQRQQRDYAIFVVEQEGNSSFNRAALMNVGFLEALLVDDKFSCFVFHDVDLLPEDDRNVYECAQQPSHMSHAVNTLNYRLLQADQFGGVSSMKREQFELVNGFSNTYWGWGGEDDDMALRIKFQGMKIVRRPLDIARYYMQSHRKEAPSPARFKFQQGGFQKYTIDGINSLQYEVKQKEAKPLCTWILVRFLKDL